MSTNSQITTRPTNGRMVTQSETDALIATLPKWLAYLVGAFPGAQVNKMTFLAYETEFADVDSGLMLEAAKLAGRKHLYNSLPLVAELHKAVEAVTEQAYLAQRQALNLYHAIGLERKTLLDAAYSGEIDPTAWHSFAAACEARGYEINAIWARRKLAQLEAAGYGA
ncbi:MAG: hypothetical protein WAS33_27135 [Candidatus Promineifilaceae bacterium]